jgi:hypothetical protein
MRYDHEDDLSITTIRKRPEDLIAAIRELRRQGLDPSTFRHSLAQTKGATVEAVDAAIAAEVAR